VRVIEPGLPHLAVQHRHPVPGRPSVSLAQHERIVAAIAARDPQQAETAMLDHITSVIESLSSLQVQPASQARGGGTGPSATV